jgi:hypothetical protein
MLNQKKNQRFDTVKFGVSNLNFSTPWCNFGAMIGAQRHINEGRNILLDFYKIYLPGLSKLQVTESR